jgi:steroid 5-alpha reductase family enzyme
MNEFFQLLGMGWISVFVFMSILWYIGKRIGNYAIVDVGWTVSLVLLCLVFFLFGAGLFERKLLILLMVSFWGIRLGGYLLFTRIIGGHGEDERYVAFRRDYGEAVDRKFFINIFQFQALLDVVLAIPFLLISINPEESLQTLEYAGLGLFVVAVIGEAVADNQLHSFKKNPENKGKNCEVGLWYYSRHPNYFFEWLIWVSYGLVSLASPYGYIGLSSPVLMYILLTKFSGVPMSEELALKKRGDVFREYQRTTSAFFPWFKKG